MAKIMNEWGLREKHGKRTYALQKQRVGKLFRNKFYTGIVSSKTYIEEIKGQHVPMITEEQFYKIQAILDGRNVNMVALATRHHHNTDFPLRRVIRCDKCGKGMTGGWSRGRNAKYAYYAVEAVAKVVLQKWRYLIAQLLN
jgi:hypothetical protein